MSYVIKIIHILLYLDRPKLDFKKILLNKKNGAKFKKMRTANVYYVQAINFLTK